MSGENEDARPREIEDAPPTDKHVDQSSAAVPNEYPDSNRFHSLLYSVKDSPDVYWSILLALQVNTHFGKVIQQL